MFHPRSENKAKTLSRIAELTVVQEGTVKIEPVRKFEDAGLHPVMLENVKLAGYNVPTPIQQYCLPAVKKGHDIVACAQTGKLHSASGIASLGIDCSVGNRFW
jgi:ATP-dependent RNA helicase DDX3X